MKFCEEGYIIYLNKGYWRINNETDLISECSNFIENCEGGTKNFTCSIGHIGALCEICDIKASYWENHFTQSSDF